jgi:hypothetical protein
MQQPHLEPVQIFWALCSIPHISIMQQPHLEPVQIFWALCSIAHISIMQQPLLEPVQIFWALCSIAHISIMQQPLIEPVQIFRALCSAASESLRWSTTDHRPHQSGLCSWNWFDIYCWEGAWSEVSSALTHKPNADMCNRPRQPLSERGRQWFSPVSCVSSRVSRGLMF